MGNTGFFFSPLLLSACYALRFSQFKHLTSENNYISTNHFWIRLNYFQTDFCLLYTAVPLYNLTQFGPVHIKQTWVRLTFKKKTKKTTHYIIPIIQAWLPPPTFQSVLSLLSGRMPKFSWWIGRGVNAAWSPSQTDARRRAASGSCCCSLNDGRKKKRVFSDPIERVNEWPRSAWCKFG